MEDENDKPADGTGSNDEPKKAGKKKAAPKKKAAAAPKGAKKKKAEDAEPAEPVPAEAEAAEPPAKGKKKPAPKGKKKAATKKAAAKKDASDGGEATETKAKKKAPKKTAAAPKGGRGRRRFYEEASPEDEAVLADESETAVGDGKALVVVESPAKAKTINKFLGKDYLVKASMGHVRDLPKKNINVDMEHGFEPTYEVLPEKKKVVAELKKAAKNARALYLACDLDREGEAIAWHISELLKAKKSNTYRVTFNEITKSAIEKAFATPRQIDMDKVNAQQARRILDRIVGYKLSQLLWKKVKPKISAGRVQSVAVKLVVEREKEIKAFNPIEYWELEATLDKVALVPQIDAALAAQEAIKKAKEAEAAKAPPPAADPTKPAEPQDGEPKPASTPAAPPPFGRFFAKLVRLGGERLDPEGFRIKDAAEAEAVRASLEKGTWKVLSVEKKERRDNPDPPFITSTLQQQASTRLRFGAQKTMRLAQQLYEGIELGPDGSVGLITYMRTDSFFLAKDAVDSARDFIRENYGERYVPDQPNAYKAKSALAQEAHEAIRPSYVTRTPESVAQYLAPDQLKLYKLIWERFVACQMPPAVFLQTTVEIEAKPQSGKEGVFRTSGRTPIFDGYRRVAGMSGGKDGETATLPDLDAEELLRLGKLIESQHFTQPPPRYTEASLVKRLEELGIGRPSTYAAIVSTIQEREYVRHDNRRFYATELGRIVTEKLEGHFKEIMDTGFTSAMEGKLDGVEDASQDWKKLLEEFYGPFERDLKTATTEMKGINENPEESTIPCPKCGKLMIYKYNKRDFQRFLGCPGYDTDGCKETMPVDEKGEAQQPEETDQTCPECGSSMLIRTGRRGRFIACSAYPKCNVTREVEEDGTKEYLAGLESDCTSCGRKMVVRRGRRGPFLGCTGYPECRETRPIVVGADGKAVLGEKAEKEKLPEVDVKCPKCGSAMKIRRSRRGAFLGCSAFPKCRGTAQVPADIKLPEPPPPKVLDEKCDQCGEPFVLRHGFRGPFKACSGYPKCRNTKPYVVEA